MAFTDRMVVTIHKKLKNLKKTVTSIRQGKNKNSKLYIQELQQSLAALSEENLSIKTQIKEKQFEVEKVKQENLNLKEEYDTKEVLFEEDKRFLYDEIKTLKSKINEKQIVVEKANEENVLLKEECKNKQVVVDEEYEINEVLKEDRRDQEISKLNKDLENDNRAEIKKKIQEKNKGTFNYMLMEEVESLRIVLELKQNEIKCLQLALADAKQKEAAFEIDVRKMHLLSTKCKDLQEQLKRKSESEQNLEAEISKLRKIILEENMQTKRLSYQNEELQWKLTHNKKTGSEKMKCNPHTQPSNIREVVKKRESIGYVLKLDESPKKVKKLKYR